MKMYFSPVFWSLVEVERVIILKSLRSSFAEKVKVQQLSVVSSLQNPTKMSLLQLLVFCGLVFSSGFFFFFFFLAAGVKRESEEEKSFGDFVIESKDSPYRTLNFTFEPYDFIRLVEVNRYNVLNSKDTLFKTLNLALQRRKLKKVINMSNT